MCGTPIWGIAGFLVCGYLAYASWARVERGDFAWTGDAWTLLTHAVWVVLMAGLFNETRCRRERIFFAVVLVNFALGMVFGVSHSAPETARHARLLVAGLWVVAALASAASLGNSAQKATHV